MDSVIKKTIYLTLLSIYCLSQIRAQHINYSHEFFSSQLLNERINQSTEYIHSSFKPLEIEYLNGYKINDTLFYYNLRDGFFSSKFKSSWFYKKLRTEDFIWLKSENFSLKVNPLLNLELKKDKDSGEGYYINTRGIEFKGDIGKKVSFYSAFYENQTKFEPYIENYIMEKRVVPGQGAAKILKDNKFDFSRAEAYLSINPVSCFNIQLGQSKHFIGEGYRSLILSDNALNYPFIKLTANYKKFQYIILWSQYQSFTGAYYNYHQRKFSAINYLSWVPKAGFEFSLIESIIWPGNTNENKNNFNINFFNPIILSRTAQFGLNSDKNILLGLNTHIKIYNFAQLYSQLVVDNIGKDLNYQNNYAFQIGFKHFDLFHRNFQNQSLFVQSELNYIAPYTYTWTENKQAFTNYNQSIAHPAGTGLKEVLGTLKYQYKDLSISFKGFYIINSIDSLNSNFGSDIFKSNTKSNGIEVNTTNKPGYGIKNELFNLTSEVAFLVNPSTNLQVFMNIQYRKNYNSLNKNENIYFSFGLKTNINNYYYDF